MYLNELPDSVLLKIFKKLSLHQIIDNRVVCKLWKCLIDEIIEKNDEIILFFETQIDNLRYWTFDGQPININRSLSINRKLFSNITYQAFFVKNNIKKLFIYFYELDTELIKTLFYCINIFFRGKLEHLEIDFKELDPRRKSDPSYKKKINLINLKKFSIKISFIEYKNFNFKFKNLEQLKIYGFELDKRSSKWAKNLIHLNTDLLDYSKFGPNFVFLKLEILRVDYVRGVIRIKMFPYLKELQVPSYSSHYESHKAALDFYLDEKKNQNRKELKIYLCGLEYNDEFRDYLSKNPDFNFLNYHYFNYIRDHISNYKFELADWEFHLSDSLIDALNGIDIEYRKKLMCNLKDNCILEQLNKLEQFKGKLIFNSCEQLRINFISQSNLNLLPSYFPNTKSIDFIDEDEDGDDYAIRMKFLNNDKKIDFNFIANFKKIKEVHYYQKDIWFMELELIIKNCNHIEKILFKNVKIQIDYYVEFEILIYLDIIGKKLIEFNSKSSLLDYLINHQELIDRYLFFDR